MERIEELCCYYIGLLRSVGIIHQNNHWKAKGRRAYSDHLLFERIYKSSIEDVDLAAEKFMGLFGVESLDLNLQAKLIQKFLDKASKEKDPIKSSLQIETEFLSFSEDFLNKLKEEDELTMGLEDMIQALASSREGAVYLLKQSLDEPTIEARISLLRKIQKSGLKKS